MNIPVPDNMFDGAICIAVVHHISTQVSTRHGHRHEPQFPMNSPRADD